MVFWLLTDGPLRTTDGVLAANGPSVIRKPVIRRPEKQKGEEARGFSPYAKIQNYFEFSKC